MTETIFTKYTILRGWRGIACNAVITVRYIIMLNGLSCSKLLTLVAKVGKQNKNHVQYVMRLSCNESNIISLITKQAVLL